MLWLFDIAKHPHRGGAEEAQRMTETLVNPLRYLRVLCASAVNGP
jgi:hypothetical protein